jgi:chemosensory pili system protein ChpA (sensor histidine kinase/response regulator)
MSAEPVFLYVEDDAMSRQIMKLILTRSLGYSQITLFEDSRNFLEKLDALPARPDVIFLDIHMRPDDGITLLRQLRGVEKYRDVKVIALTASVMNEEVVELQQAGFDGGIAKPVDQKTFPILLQQILNGESVWHIM